MRIKTIGILLLASAVSSSPAFAIDGEGNKRTRIDAGVQAMPKYPGSDDFMLAPLVGFARASEGEVFDFEGPDESFGFSLIDGPLGIGPVLGYEGSRKAKDVGAPLDKVKATFEPGAFIQYELVPSFRVRAEGRRGIGGHKGWVGMVSADYILRDGDAWLFSIGPRLTMSDGRYHRAYFGVTPAESLATGLATFRPKGGIQAVGGTAGLLFQLSSSVGLVSYAKYDRLVRDAGDSPIVREYGSRHQWSGGLGLSYTFGGGASD